MREIRLSGSVRGVRRKPYPYRDPLNPMPKAAPLFGEPANGCQRWPTDARGQPSVGQPRAVHFAATHANTGGVFSNFFVSLRVARSSR